MAHVTHFHLIRVDDQGRDAEDEWVYETPAHDLARLTLSRAVAANVVPVSWHSLHPVHRVENWKKLGFFWKEI